MKFWEINNAIKDEMRLDPGLVTSGERVRFINDCLDEIGALQLIQLTKTESVSAQYPTLPTGLAKLQLLYWEGQRLVSVEPDEYDAISTGTPVGYALQAGVIRLIPAPMGAGSLTWVYTGTPNHASDADIEETAITSPGVPDSWHRLLIDYGCYRSHRKNGNIVMAREYKSDYDKGLANNIRAYVSYLNTQNVKITSREPSYGWWD